jgi:hypothetical protein
MTVSANETIRQPFDCGAATVDFVFTIPCYSSSDIKVYKRLVASPYTKTDLYITADYTIAPTGGNYLNGGKVTMNVAPGTSYKLYIARKLVQTQETAQASITPISTVAALDKLTRQIQDLQWRLDRCQTLSPTDDADDMIIPAVRASLTAKYDASGDPTAS